ncbi:hypothetical protein K9374_004554, partial [Salmonella enterica subsp. enterica serovar Enteritidis]|nr:hypothetical protein [Salmonella enterica subsp. enterica serovar Enteritidis]
TSGCDGSASGQAGSSTSHTADSLMPLSSPQAVTGSVSDQEDGERGEGGEENEGNDDGAGDNDEEDADAACAARCACVVSTSR